MDGEKENPRSVFSYGTLRKDYLLKKDLSKASQDTPWTGDRWDTTGDAVADHGYIGGFKLYQTKDCYYPFVSKSENKSERVFGTILTWSKEQFPEQLRQCDCIEGYYEDRDQEHNLYQRDVVKVYKDAKLT